MGQWVTVGQQARREPQYIPTTHVTYPKMVTHLTHDP